MKTGIMLEGGGMRGVYTIGVLDCLMGHGIRADYVVGVSAGACHGVSYVSGQRGRSLRVNREYVGDKRYISLDNYRKTGSLFGMDFIFGEIPDVLDPFDYEAFYQSHTAFEAGVTDVLTGKPVFYGKEFVKPGNVLLRASSAIPCFSPMVAFESGLYLDGGTAAPLPVERALEMGCDRVLTVLTRERAYRKKPERLTYYRRQYKEYPNLVRTLDRRHEIYNRQLARIRELERQGKVLVIAPPRSLGIGRFDKDMKKLFPAYLQGTLDTQKRLEEIKAFFGPESAISGNG